MEARVHLADIFDIMRIGDRELHRREHDLRYDTRTCNGY